jgi:FKBP-type peptidyl-prolyl cis-trans isomerase FklB
MKNVKKALGLAAVAVLAVLAGAWMIGKIASPASAQGPAKGAPAAPAACPPMKDVSYCIGMKIGQDMKRQDIALSPDDFIEGLKNALAGGKPRMGEAEMDQTLMAFSTYMKGHLMEKMKQIGEENQKKGDEFLAKNKTAAGVKTLPSGLQYKVLKEGTGKQPTATDTVTVNYRGTLLDGTEFDSSYTRKEPATLAVNEIIPGWTEALQLMKEGAKWQLFVPAGMAYGERGAGPVVGPNAVLIFEVELIKVK